MRIMRFVICLSAVVLMRAGCTVFGVEMGTEEPARLTEQPTEAQTAIPTDEPAEVPTSAPTEAAPIVPAPAGVEFESEDGTVLVGTYFPPAVSPAPAVLLVHQFGVDRSEWEGLTDLLTMQAEPGAPTYAVLSYDLPEHGESGGSATNEAIRASIRAGLAYLRAQPEVDASRIVIIGASVGADGAVSECGEGCIGAISVSPGDYLGTPYTAALRDVLAPKNAPALCLAAEGDFPSPGTCEGGIQAGLADYQIKIYEGSAHGNRLLTPHTSPAPPPLELIMMWLGAHLPLD